ncbi:MAG: septation protein SepH [Nakamurella sp.]
MQAHARTAPADTPPADDIKSDTTTATAVGSPTALDAPEVTAVPPRALRILGLTAHRDRVVCVEMHPSDSAALASAAGPAAATHSETDPAEPRFTLAIDERLRAAVRGDLGSGAKGEIDMTSGLRPREIQSRIRAGASLEQVAAAAGCPVERIEGFAYPVLQERAMNAERARSAHPLKGAAGTLEEIVTRTLADRGQQGDIQWDAFKDERGWTVTLTWQAGRSENRAEWAFSARPGGGTVTARNTEAEDLLEPRRAQLRPVDQVRTRNDAAPRETFVEPSAGHSTTLGSGVEHTAASTSQSSHSALAHSDHSTAHGTETAARTSEKSDATGADPTAESTVVSATAPSARTARRGHRPPMPSWEDVLLGTRTSEH